MAVSRPRSSSDICTPALALVIRRGWIQDTPEIQAAWGRYDADRNSDDFQSLVEHYSPRVLHEAFRLKKHAPWRYPDPIEELIGDGLVALARYIHQLPPGVGMPSKMYYMRKAIRSSIAIAAMKRSKSRGGMRSLDEEPENGSSPLNQMVSADRFMDGEYRNSGTNEPFQPMLNSEVLRLMMRGLDDQEKKLLRRLMRDTNVSEIAREFGVSRQRMHQRVNQLAWALSQRADLAEYLGLDAATPPPPGRKRYLAFKAENSPKSGGMNVAYLRGPTIGRGLHPGMQSVQVPDRSIDARRIA